MLGTVQWAFLHVTCMLCPAMNTWRILGFPGQTLGNGTPKESPSGEQPPILDKIVTFYVYHY